MEADKELIQIFLFVTDEYERTINGISASSDIDALNQVKLALLRKYESKTSNVYLPKVINASMKIFPHASDKFNKIQEQVQMLENEKIELYLSDGTLCNFHDVIEDVMYGVYLHANVQKCKHLMHADRRYYYWLVRQYIDKMEPLVLNTKKLLYDLKAPRLEPVPYKKSPVIFLGKDNQQLQIIKPVPYWSNLRGRDATNSELSDVIRKIPDEEMQILAVALNFMKMASEDQYSVQKLSRYVFPPTIRDWGDFSEAHKFFAENKWGVSTKIRYYEKSDMACVKIFKNLTSPIMINQPQMSEDVSNITLVKQNEDFGWRVFSIGSLPDYYQKTGSLIGYLKALEARKHK